MNIVRETQRPGHLWRLRRMLYVPVMAMVSALVAIGPADTAGAQSSAPGTNVEASAEPPAGDGALPAEEVALTEADRDFVTKVRLAGLWEIPASKMAVKKGVAPRVREIGKMISSQHFQLDFLARTAAAQVGVELPNVPNADQQGWLDEMANASGADFDDVYIERLRAAHGKIFPVIGLIRASTQNDTVRKLAQDANAFVLTHLTLLESTGLVRYEELPTAAEAAAAAAKAPAAAAKAPAAAVPPIANAAAPTAGEGGIATPIIWLLLVVVLIGGLVFTTRMIWPQGFGEPQQRGRDLEYPSNTGSAPDQFRDDHYQRGGNFYPEGGLRLSRSPRSRH